MKVLCICLLIGVVAVSQLSARGIVDFENMLEEMTAYDAPSCSAVCNTYLGWSGSEVISICIKLCQELTTPQSSTTPPYYPTDYPTYDHPSDFDPMTGTE
eukprot:TRINITY_DN6957_c0_g1_i1.p1 TRINITY_DN6957_c0_g1~~TRINITY_DN6957_c0_g1_i1.p1  ORF type:complete len:100 (-),score=15.96 TRINITY_DN6957_c0_g1_i1:156-455(-)